MDNISKYTVIWVGDKIVASYYGLFFNDSNNPVTWPKKLKVYSSKDLLNDADKIDSNKNLIVLFKRYDTFDPQNKIRNYITKFNYNRIFETQDFFIYEQNK